MRLELRPYQTDTLDRIDAAEARGVRRLAVTAATGLGKTVMFCALAERRQARTLILAHRDELISQAAGKVREIWPDARIGIVKAIDNQVNAQVVVASVQTLARPSRLGQLLPTGQYVLPGTHVEPFDLVIVDEMHHAAADSYVAILDGLNAGKPDGPLLVGFTATLDRGDGKGLDHLFEEVVADWPILWGIQQGFLCDLRGLRIKIAALDLRKVKKTAGDYNQGQAGAALEDAGAPKAIAAAWSSHAADRKRTLVFTPTVATAQQVADEFNALHVQAEWVSGETPLEQRRSILKRFESGVTKVLANCAVLTEGYDNPAVDCVVVARPTQSRALYTQMIGRGTRRFPGKADCLVLDVVGGSDVHSLVSLPSLFGADVKEFEGKDLPVAQFLEEQAEEDVRLGRISAHEAELFRTVRQTGICWVAVHEPGERARYVCTLRRDEPTIVLAQLSDDAWGVVLRKPAQRMQAGFVKYDYAGAGNDVIVRDVSQQVAQGMADQWVRDQESSVLARSDAAWRNGRPSEKTIKLARKLKLDVPRGAKAGELSDAINGVLAKRAERKYLDDVARRAVVSAVN